MNPDIKNFSLQIFSSIILFVISFFFIFWIGSYFEVDIFPLENRVTNQSTFHIYIFDKYVDSIIITLLTSLWLCLSIQGKKRIVSAISYVSLFVAALLTNFGPLLDAAVLISIPIISSFFIYHHFSNKKNFQIQTNVLLSFLVWPVLSTRSKSTWALSWQETPCWKCTTLGPTNVVIFSLDPLQKLADTILFHLTW